MNARLLLVLFLVLCLHKVTPKKRCMKSRIRFCSSLGYRDTSKENIVGQSNQRHVLRDNVFRDLQRLHKTGCSDYVKPLACSVYAPPCSESWKFDNLPPCRSVCNAVKTSCITLIMMLKKRKSKVSLDCSLFPEPSSTAGCVDWVMEDFELVMKIRGTPTKEQLENKRIPQFYRSN